MKNILNSFFLFFTIILNAQTSVELSFLDDCEGKIFQGEFEVNSVKNPNEFYASSNSKIVLPDGKYIISFGKMRGERIHDDQQILEIRSSIKIVDTLVLPKITFGYSSEDEWDYYNCDKVCNGIEKDYYKNGNIKLEGNFKNGKPLEITKYRNDGSKRIKYWYLFGTIDYGRIEHYDEKGKLREYEVHSYKNDKVLKKIYNSKDKLIRSE